MEAWLLSLIIGGVSLMISAGIQLGSLVWVLATLKGDTRVLNAHLEAVTKELEAQSRGMEKQNTTLEVLVAQRQDIAIIQERQLLQGRRLDRVDEELTKLRDIGRN